ncbi:hypothetical protein IFM89_009540 [Coptis chinensis]|uniref:Uncharacterized protein n=1 Tax=Coptis chinensis TaxID=261450 RepID=A0A835IBB9_9MAGN|nr:hypothetical protein IFM89_009540 [Coptis chinensis]
MRGFRLGNACHRFLMGFLPCQPTKCLCTSANKSNTNKIAEGAASVRDLDAYRQLDKLDFMTAAKMLFTTPPKKKKFGVFLQAFLALSGWISISCNSSFAACLHWVILCCSGIFGGSVRRYEIKRMEAEAEVKKKQTEEVEKAKEQEALALEEEKRKSDPELLEVKVRLDALEEAVKGIAVESKKGIAVESKKPSASELTKDRESTWKEKLQTGTSKSVSKSQDSTTVASDRLPDLNSGSTKPDPSQKRVTGPNPAINDQLHDPQKGKS